MYECVCAERARTIFIKPELRLNESFAAISLLEGIKHSLEVCANSILISNMIVCSTQTAVLNHQTASCGAAALRGPLLDLPFRFLPIQM